MSATPKPLVAGNWKMNGLNASLREARAVAARMNALSPNCDVAICPPFTLLTAVSGELGSTVVSVGAQDCHPNASGAHTGDVAAEMIAECGAKLVIVGHSERRADHGEGDALVAAKAQAAWRAGLSAIICVGESEAQRDAGDALSVVGAQLAASIPDGAGPGNTIIAYEPVWAIGTGRTPSAEDVGEMHTMIRENLAGRLGDAARQMRILYGGSVKAGNARELMAVANVDGALVGGASLKAEDFLGIIAAYSR